MVDNLRVLSLHYVDHSGWGPKMDFRGLGKDKSPFPWLEALALGKYTIYNDWQVDWFATVGLGNGSGGLRELYLDSCPILYQVQQPGAFNRDNPDYPSNFTTVHHVLSKWTASMKGLQVFPMGSSVNPQDVLRTIEKDPAYASVLGTATSHRIGSQKHRTFACPEETDIYVDSEETLQVAWVSGKYWHGVGITTWPCDRAQYVEYAEHKDTYPFIDNLDSFSKTEGFEPWAPEEGTSAKDMEAYGELLKVVNARARRASAS
ncbi:hypothetical protein NM208_g175 [Fusarium decemcellulare]|uniref:Uncharacterized protein n=2 Tax=Fusarium decemcellulare TaxID=57161 RepID=A0ACC1T089_9HYPO|nr:hypothetical protein NM208_g4165 [Fusarium decemcellulare]KAJ3550074.1 hypothetical protein NM208_g175 [Fusarium decemcellulare]